MATKNIKQDWHNLLSYQTEEMTVGKFKKCHLKCEHLIWMKDNSLFCKRKLKHVEEDFVCDE